MPSPPDQLSELIEGDEDMQRKILKFLTLSTVALFLAGCGVTTTSASSFKVRMHGIYSPPVGAEGNSTPRSQTYLLKSINLTKADGTPVELFSGTGSSLKIIDRGQLIHADSDTSDYDGTSFSSALVTFDPVVLVTSKGGNTTSVELSSGDLQLDEAFTITKNKERVLTIKVAWGDTITTADDGSETLIPPTFSLKYEDGD